MSNFVANEVLKYLDGLPATSAICVSLGTTLTSGTNLFSLIEPSNEVATRCLTIIPYGGTPPSPEGYRQESNVQLRFKTPYPEDGLRFVQQVIDTFHTNTHVCASKPGKVYAVQSSPILIDRLEGEFYIFVSNFRIKHVKLS